MTLRQPDNQPDPLKRIVVWACNTHGPQMLMAEGDQRPECAECGQPMLAVPYLREFDAKRETAAMKDALYQIGYRGAHPVITAKVGLGDLPVES